jgi:hypothetical protein
VKAATRAAPMARAGILSNPHPLKYWGRLGNLSGGLSPRD